MVVLIAYQFLQSCYGLAPDRCIEMKNPLGYAFQCIDQVQAHNNSEEINWLLITKEAYWSAQLFSLARHGLNKRKEFHSKNRICYN